MSYALSPGQKHDQYKNELKTLLGDNRWRFAFGQLTFILHTLRIRHTKTPNLHLYLNWNENRMINISLKYNNVHGSFPSVSCQWKFITSYPVCSCFNILNTKPRGASLISLVVISGARSINGISAKISNLTKILLFIIYVTYTSNRNVILYLGRYVFSLGMANISLGSN